MLKRNTPLIPSLFQSSHGGSATYDGHMDVTAVPADGNVEAWAGPEIADFCGDYALNRIVAVVKREEGTYMTNLM